MASLCHASLAVCLFTGFLLYNCLHHVCRHFVYRNRHVAFFSKFSSRRPFCSASTTWAFQVYFLPIGDITQHFLPPYWRPFCTASATWAFPVDFLYHDGDHFAQHSATTPMTFCLVSAAEKKQREESSHPVFIVKLR
jgi:hypothetical protein